MEISFKHRPDNNNNDNNNANEEQAWGHPQLVITANQIPVLPLFTFRFHVFFFSLTDEKDIFSAVSWYVVNRKQTFVDLTLEKTPCLHAVLAQQPKNKLFIYTVYWQQMYLASGVNKGRGRLILAQAFAD